MEKNNIIIYSTADGKQYNVTFYSLDLILAKELKILENNIKTQRLNN
jgi:hypothetical protein